MNAARAFASLEHAASEDEDDDLMFELEQDDAPLSSSFQSVRPPNPVAALLRGSSTSYVGENEDERRRRRPSLPQSQAQAKVEGGTPTLSLFDDFNGRRKRKHSSPDEGHRMTKRAKSFSSLSDVLPPLATFRSIGTSITGKPASLAISISSSSSISASASASPAALQARATAHACLAPRSESKSIRIPQSSLRESPLLSRSITQYQLLGRRCKSAEPRTSASWHARTPSPLDNCRRSLDISSPLRERFRDMVVGSLGQHTGSLSSS